MKSKLNSLIKIHRSLLVLCFILIDLSLFADSKQDFTNGCAFYSQKQYTEALNAFLQINKRNEGSSVVYENIGNCYFKLNEYHLAILYYEKGLKIEPNNEDLNYNLAIAKTRIVDKIESLPQLFIVKWWNDIVDLKNERTWTILSLFMFSLFLFLLGAFIVSRYSAKRKFYFFASIFALCLSVLIGLISYSSYQKQCSISEAILISPSLDVKSSPDINSKTIFILHQGSKVELKDKINDWYEIKIANGNLGWAKKTNFEKI